MLYACNKARGAAGKQLDQKIYVESFSSAPPPHLPLSLSPSVFAAGSKVYDHYFCCTLRPIKINKHKEKHEYSQKDASLS